MEDKHKEVMDSLKEQVRIHIEHLLSLGVRNVNIEIEMLHYIKKVIYQERD
jgi:uncharacterized alkaline shock family protein YloU